MINCFKLSEDKMVKIERKSKTLFIRKRPNQWENEVHKTSPQPEAPCYGDRFIPIRFRYSLLEHNAKFLIKKEVKDVLKSNLSTDYWRQNCFTPLIDYAFGIKERRVFEYRNAARITSPTTISAEENRLSLYLDSDWQCKPRLKPMAFMDATHDLPEFSQFFDYNLMDWSVKDQIAVSFGNNVIIWKSRAEITMIFAIKCPTALAYSPNGLYLAIGSLDANHPVLELWEVNPYSHFFVNNFVVFNKSDKAVTCIEWSKYGNELVVGTNVGKIHVLSIPYLDTKHIIPNNKLPIKIMRFSPTMRYLAIGDSHGNITIFKWSFYEVYLHVRSKLNLRVTFDWHPWNGVDLAISENLPASIIILHVPSQEIVAFYQRFDTKVNIHSINFSKITGELLVSISKRDSQGCVKMLILVMSSLNRIVDMLDIPDSGARFMMWSPDGTTLTTGGHDETLSIWKFHPKSTKQKEIHFKQSPILKFSSQLDKWCSLK